MKRGAFTFVLHSHIPYCRKAGRWPHGEEWLHESLSESYLPLLDALYDLRDEGSSFKLTIGITPILAEQIADPLVLEHFAAFIADKADRASSDIARFEREGIAHLVSLAQHYLEFYQGITRSFDRRFGRDLIGAFRTLQDEGHIEVLTSAATHGYLPLMERDSSIYGQLKIGVDTYQRHFNRPPRAVWLPECGYRPSCFTYRNGRAYLRPGIESYLAELHLGLFFSESHVIQGGPPAGNAIGVAAGPYGDIVRHLATQAPCTEPTMGTTFLPYRASTSAVAVLGRDVRTGMQVWSADCGYPGDFDYREFHKKDGVSGLQYWRVTGHQTDLAHKDLYRLDWAADKARNHAEHFSRLVEELVSDFHARSHSFGIVTAAYDTELFGHWWFEGVQWLKEVLRRLCNSEIVQLATASEFIADHPPEDTLSLDEGSWGQAGGHFTWKNPHTESVWSHVHNAELRMEHLIAQHPDAHGDLAAVVQQAARELLLLQSSDWPFLITTGQAREYAANRFLEHLSRFNRMADAASAGTVDEPTRALCQHLFELDNVFPDIDYRAFTSREATGTDATYKGTL